MFRFWYVDVGVRWRVGMGLGLGGIRTFTLTSVLATTSLHAFLLCNSYHHHLQHHRYQHNHHHWHHHQHDHHHYRHHHYHHHDQHSRHHYQHHHHHHHHHDYQHDHQHDHHHYHHHHQLLRWGKKSYFGDPSWKMHFKKKTRNAGFKGVVR